MASATWGSSFNDDNKKTSKSLEVTPPRTPQVEQEDQAKQENQIRFFYNPNNHKFFRVPKEDIDKFFAAAKDEGFEPAEVSEEQIDEARYKYYSTLDGIKQFRVPVAEVDEFISAAENEGLKVVQHSKKEIEAFNKINSSQYAKMSNDEFYKLLNDAESKRISNLHRIFPETHQRNLDALAEMRKEAARRFAWRYGHDAVNEVLEAGSKLGEDEQDYIAKLQKEAEEDRLREIAKAKEGDSLGPIEKLKAEYAAQHGTDIPTGALIALTITPFAGTIDQMVQDSRNRELARIAKGDFELDEIPSWIDPVAYPGGYTKEAIQKQALQMLSDKALTRSKAKAALDHRGVSVWGNIASGGMQGVGMAGEFALPGGAAVKLGVPAAVAAAGAYSDLRTERYGLGEDGSLVQENAADSAGTAAVKAVAFGGTRVAVERFGGKLLGKTFNLTVGKGLSKIGSTKIATKIANSTLGRGVGSIVNFAKSPIKLIGWDGLPEEMGEEYLEGAINTAFGLDMTESEKGDTNPFSRLSDFTGDFFKADNLQALAQSMLLMQAWGGGAAYLRKRYNSKQASQIILQTVDGYSEKQLNKLSLEKKCEIIAQHFKGLKKSQIESIIVNGASAVSELIESLNAYNQVGLAKKREITSDMDAQLDAKIAEYASDENIARMIKDDITANLEDNAVFSDPEAFDEMVAISARKFEPETMRLKVHDIRGTSMNEGQKISEIENLGVTDWQSAEQAGLTEKDRFGRYTGGAVRALNVIFHGTPKLQEEVKAGTVSGNLAENLLTAATCELGGRSVEERGELIDGILDRANGDEALANAMIRQFEADVDLSGTISEKLDRALTEAKAEVLKKRNPSASSDEINGALVEPVEKPDGTITTTGEFVHGESGANTERPMPSTPLEGVEEAARLKGAELTFAPEGELKCQSFPEMRVSVSDNGVALNNLSGVNIADPARSAEFAAVVAQVVNIAKRNGLQIIVDEVHKPIIQALIREIQSAGLAKTQAKLDTRAKLFSLLFKTTLGTGVTYDENSFVKALKNSTNAKSLVNNHGDIYGLVDADGVLHFNPAVMNFNTPIHEYGHLALDAIKKINPKLWEQGKKLIRDSEYYRSIVEQSNDPENPYSWAKGNDDAICDEALATMIGDRGEKLVLDRGVDSKLKAWLKEVWKAFKGAFGLADLSDEQIEKMTLERFVDTINAELLSGREFGTKKKLPPSEKSVKRYDEAEGSGSNGLLRWRNDRGYLFAIPVDMERTQPGGKVVFATDAADITDWIQSTLNGYDLRMSKSGKLYVKGRNGLPDELALIFGRFPTIGGNDGLGLELANSTGIASYNLMTPDQLVASLKSDRANYDAWAKAKADGKSFDEARQEEHYADEAAREEAERKAHWENSGMGILDYIRSRMEDGDPEFDLDWEIAREMANDRAEARFSIGGIYTGSAADYANRSRQGGVDDGPSLVKIGSGEGAQVYGWGLYGTTVRGVAEGYAQAGLQKKHEITHNGKVIQRKANPVTAKELAEAEMISAGDVKSVASSLAYTANFKKGKEKALYRAAAKYAADHADEYKRAGGEYIYEQTFFTDRVPGDESHLLKWYEPVSDEQIEWIKSQAIKEGWTVKNENGGFGGFHLIPPNAWKFADGKESGAYIAKGDKGSDIYDAIANTLGLRNRVHGGDAKSTSEFLARAGIDGVKYPVDSYGGKTVKDGDEAGWNYVSFRDDNIRVDHKWTDGKIRFSIGGVLKRSGKDGKIVDVDQQRLTAVMRGLETGELKHPRFTQDEFAASKGVRHERLWSYLLSLESPDIHAGGGQGIDGGKGGNDSQGSKGMGLVRRVATRYGSNPEKVIASRHKYFDKGVESKVYVTGGDTVIKVRKLNAYDLDGVKHELAKIVYHNYLFPNDAYTLRDIAVWNKNGYDQFYLIIEQPLVRPKTDANGNIIAPSEEAILKALNSAGRRFSQWDEAWNRRAADVDDDLYSSDDDFSSDDFVASGRKMAYNDEFVVYDFKPGRNTFIDAETGEIRFIDPRVDINDPGAGFSVSKFGKRKIDNRSMSFDGSPSNAGRARFHRVRGVDWSDITMDIFKFVPSGTLTAMGETEQSAAGLAGAIEKRGALRPWTKADSPADRAKPIAFDAADMVMFWRAVSGSLRNPHVQKGERIKGRPNAIGLNIGGDRIEIVSKLFGVIDESDIKKLHEDCRADGYFRNENTDWCAANNKGAIEDERLRSQAELDRRTRDLYKTRVETGAGGEHYATQVLGHEIGHTLGLLPTGAKLGKAGDAMRTLYKAFGSELKRQSNPLKLKKGEKALTYEINKLIAWWHGTETMPEYYAEPKEKFAELFGIFLTQPESVQSQAPKAYDLCVKLIAGNEKLTKAYQTITSLKWDGKSNDAVMAEVRKTWDNEAQDQYRELVKLTKESISLKRDKFFYAFDDRFGPMFAVAKRSLKKLKHDLKEAVRNRTISEKEAADIIKTHEDEINALKTSLYNFQRHTGGSTRLMVSMFDDVAAQAEKDGVNWNDVRDYAHYMRVIELGGRATAHAVDPARASAILDRMRQKLGDEKWLKIEKTWKAYRATYEKYVLDDPYVQELFDAETMKMLYNNKHYITMRHRMSLEEAKDWQERIEKSKKGEDNLWDPCIDIQRRLQKGLGGSNGEGGGFVLYHLVGSFEATEDPLAATIRRAIEIKESAARNHLLKQMSDTLRSLGVKGVYDKVAESKETIVDRDVYRKFYYMDSGVTHELIVPKVIHNSMTRNVDDVKWFNKAFRFWKNLVTSWSPRFVSRAYRMDISSMETNIKGMHKAPVDVLSEALCFGYVGVPLYLVNDYIARFTRLSKTPFGKILWNENTANHYAYQAQQIVKIAYEGRYSERLAEARRLRDVGETSRAKEIEENVALAQEMMKLNIFQSNYNFNKQLAGFDGDEIMHQFGYRLNGKNDRKVADSLAKRLWAWSKGQARKGGRWWTRLGEEQEAVPKVIAMLYQMKKGITGEKAAATAIEYGGTPNLSRRGAHANFVEALTGAFWNVRKNATLRTAKAIMDHPTEWMVKNFAQTAMPTIVKYLMIGGVVEELIRNLFDDDEEKIKNNTVASMMYEHSKFIRESMKCVPGYLQRNYNVIPWAKYGNEVLSFKIKYSPEEFMIKRTIHGLFQAWGADPSDPSADWSDLTKELMNSVLPDVFGENSLMQMAQIVIGPLTGDNPFDNFRGRYIYDPTLFEARGDNKGAMAVEMLKQLYNISPLNQLGRFSDGQDRNVDYSDMPKWLDVIVNGPIVSLMPGAYLSITSDDSYLRALADIDNRQKAYARIVAGDLLAECIENGRLGGFEEGLKDLPPELKRLAIRYVINGWRQYHMDPNAKKLRTMRRIKDPNLKRKARKWIEDAEKYGD